MKKWWNNDDKFKLEFIKYFPDIAMQYKLSPTDTLLYWLIIAVIEFQEKVNNNPVCFMSSKTMSDYIGKKTWSIDNAIKKLKDKWLIEIRNKYMHEYRRRSRYIYKPWVLKTSWWKVEVFFKEYNVYNIEQYHSTEAIIWNILYKHNYTYNRLNNLLARFVSEYKTDSDELDARFLRQLYEDGLIEYYTSNEWELNWIQTESNPNERLHNF